MKNILEKTLIKSKDKYKITAFFFISCISMIFYVHQISENKYNYQKHYKKSNINQNQANNSNFYTIERYGSLEPSDVTVVSVYFQLNKSKHSGEKYKNWTRNFFHSVSSPLVIFTDKHSIKDLLELRNLLKLPTSLYVTDSIWKVMMEIEQERSLNYTFNYQNKQQSLDREKHIHNPNLYALWNLKSFMVNKIAQENFYKSSSFIYTDSGAWRFQTLENWPDKSIVMNITNLLNDKILFGQLSHESNALRNKNFPDVDLIEGGFFMGSQRALNHFKDNFWRIHDERLERGLFVGKDQLVMNIYAYNMSNSVKLDIWRKNCSLDLNGWFFYQNYLALKKYYDCTGDRESLLSIKRKS